MAKFVPWESHSPIPGLLGNDAASFSCYLSLINITAIASLVCPMKCYRSRLLRPACRPDGQVPIDILSDKVYLISADSYTLYNWT